jgi:hypothetical protein
MSKQHLDGLAIAARSLESLGFRQGASTKEKPPGGLRQSRPFVWPPHAERKLFFFSRDMVPSIQIEMESELSIFAPLRQALLCCFRFYQ